ncbi:MAG: guanine deaminase [Betaproteobacteria bacterium]
MPASKQTDGHALRGELVSFEDDPRRSPHALCHYADGLLVVRGGRIAEVGDAAALLPRLAPGFPLEDHRGRLILPGFVDSHVHYPQAGVIASHGERLLGWLERYTFPAERAFADAEVAREAAEFFLDELLRNGTTSAAVFCTVHAASAEALFGAAHARRMRMAAGKVLMDRNCPEYLRDTAQSGYDESKALIGRWHGEDRLAYAVTPRFAPTSTEAQLESAGALLREHPGVLMQTHLAENREEVAWVRELFPSARSYTDVYHRFGLLRPGAVLAHGIWLEDAERACLAESGAAIAFCPSSNLFIGSGLFPYRTTQAAGVRIGLGTDVGGGTSFSMLQTMQDAYKVTQLAGERFDALDGYYLATLGAARALGMDNAVGSLAPGREADLVVLDPAATPLLARRTARAETLEEKLFALMMLGDDRAVAATYVLGEKLRHR